MAHKFATIHGFAVSFFVMIEINPVISAITDLQGRLVVLRGYL